jgi:hypothetical protein
VRDCDYIAGGTSLSKAGERTRKKKEREREREKELDQNRGCGGDNGSEVGGGREDEGGEAVGGRVGQFNDEMEPPKAVTMAVTMRGWLLMKGKAQILKSPVNTEAYFAFYFQRLCIVIIGPTRR